MKSFHPLTPSLRHTSLIDHSLLGNLTLNTFLTGIMGRGGRNHHGHITVRHQGGGHKKSWRKMMSCVEIFQDIPFRVTQFTYDPTRSSFILLLRSVHGVLGYYLGFNGAVLGQHIKFHSNIPTSYGKGDNFLLKYMNPGSISYNLSIYPFMSSQLIKSAGCCGILLRKDEHKAYIKLPSRKVIGLSLYCTASLGIVSNRNYRYRVIGKAGRSRWLGIRPTVRGVAMNPVDHPHGGGEGKKSKNVCPRSPWGKLSKGQKLKKNRYNNNLE